MTACVMHVQARFPWKSFCFFVVILSKAVFQDMPQNQFVGCLHCELTLDGLSIIATWSDGRKSIMA